MTTPLQAVKSLQDYKVLNRERYQGRGKPRTSDYDVISKPKLRKVKEHKDYTNHLIIAGLTALFLFSAFNGWLSGETLIN
jgi:hypothetical protein